MTKIGRNARSASSGVSSVYGKMRTTLRRTIAAKLLPPKRIGRAERLAVEQAIAADPEVNRAVEALLAERPELRRRIAAVSVQGSAER